jgi:hypothetical protein
MSLSTRLILPNLFLLLALLSGCGLRDPAGTSWTTTLSVEATPETLRVANVLDHESVTVEGDSLLVFRQVLEASYARLGDSLVWDGARGAVHRQAGPLRLDGMLAFQTSLGFAQVWPQYASLVGQTARIQGTAQVVVEFPLGGIAGVEWIAFQSSRLEVGLEHGWPFPLGIARLDWLTPQGTVVAGVELAPQGGLAAGQRVSATMDLSGMVTAQDRLRLTLRHLPMDQVALITSGALELGLEQSAGTADSARVVPPPMEFIWSLGLPVDPRLVVRRARTESAHISLHADNSLALPLELELDFSQLRTPTGGSVQLAHSVPSQAGTDRIWELGALDVEDDQGLALLNVAVLARSPAGAGLVTLRATDELRLELDVRRSPLQRFEGSFTQPVLVPIEAAESDVSDWPEELTLLSLDQLDMGLEVDYSGGAHLEADLLLEARESRLGMPDTSFHLLVDVDPGDTLVSRPGAGRLISHLPGRLRVSGGYRIPAGVPLELDQSSRAGVRALRLPARARVASLRWQSVPERHEEAVPEEVARLRLRGFVENRLPAGGNLCGWVASSLDAPRVELFRLAVEAAQSSEQGPLPILSTVDVELTPAALAVLRGSNWHLGYQFDADATGGTVEVHADQWLAVHARIEADVELEVDGGGP